MMTIVVLYLHVHIIRKQMLGKYLKFILITLIVLSSCQEESALVIDEQPQENITLPLVNLLANMASNDGSIDNIIDGASCIEIVLPVNVVVNGLDITVDSHNDLQIIEAILDNSADDADSVSIIFPITITLPDFTTLIINNEEELLVHTSSCDMDNIEDEDIECLDFVYPITFSLFNIDAVEIDSININSDQELYSFITSIEENIVVSLNYPIQVVLWDGTVLNVNSQDELEIALEVAQDACDEDDDNDFNDDDNINQDIEYFIGQLTDCLWEIETFIYSEDNLTSEFLNFHVDFNDNFTITLFSDNSNHTGTWSIEEQGNSFRITISIDTLPIFSNNWLLHTIEDNDVSILDLRDALNVLRFQENCDIEDNDAGILYTVEEVTLALQTCEWVLDVDQNGEYFFYDFTFNDNQTILVANLLNGQSLSGNWELLQTNDGEIEMSITNLSGELNMLNDNWLIQDFVFDFITLENEDQNILTMSQTCPNNLDLTQVLLNENWKVTYFEINGQNETAILSTFVFDFDLNNQVFAIENGVDGILGSWESLNNDLGLSIDFGSEDPLFNLNSDYWTVLDLQETRVELVYLELGNLYVAVFESN